ncbi:MAG: UDP-N-acetylglucosamine--N-acetylmuramyl-(pentapeptide) pyrophosphoryl-undecaprenol N-acetylglucosamine transferase, partial [Candidatus Omnitrophica bacterium]|nr:UDP-N-acetylglucosamine--N-acetylmuramyl-(pentapeptide) pyrophosphoryl-undecaprenol N-acetylglucosamine transferase [Candidatus Omnitrophota bacterium]
PLRSATRRAQAVGIPLRDTIRIIDKTRARAALGLTESPVIFCFGGSQGSAFLNSTCLRLAREIKEDFQIIHLTGKREYFQITQFYNTIEKTTFVRDFYYSMELLYSAADAVITRCGASTLAEIIYYKLPALLVPYPAAGAHQEANAAYFRKRGAAFMFTQENFSFDEFAEVLTQVLFNTQLRERLRENLSAMDIEVGIEKFYRAVCA